VITAFELEDQYFNGDDDNRRGIDAEVAFPDETIWQGVLVKVD